MGNIIKQKIAGVWTPVDEDEWDADEAAVIAEVLQNRKNMRLDDEESAEEAERLLNENLIEDDDE